MEQILKYFSNLTPEQIRQFGMLFDLYADWNSKINVISRKDVDNLYEHHVLHSLAIAKLVKFKESTQVLDVGTGGGFPGIPLAIMFPNVTFHLVDSVGKKIRVAQEVASAIGLTNCEFFNERVEKMSGKYDFIVSRAVMPMNELIHFTKHLYKHTQCNGLPNGYICLKGGDLTAELRPYKNKTEVIGLETYFNEEYFQTKKIVYLPY